MRLAFVLGLSTVLAAPALADPLLAPGHVLGNGSATARTATDAPIGDVLTQAGVWVQPNIDPRDYGAKCDGIADDTTALQAMAAAVVKGSKVFIPGVCVFTQPLVFPQVDNVFIDGNGSAGQLLYAGANTTNDVVVIGAAAALNGCAVKGWTIQNFHVYSSTQMTAGDGVKISDACQFDMLNIKVGGGFTSDYRNKFYNAIHFNGGNTVRVRGYAVSAANDALAVNGDGLLYQFTDLFLGQGQVLASGVGVHICGNVGGFAADMTDVLSNGTNVLIDQTCAAKANSQMFFGPNFFVDATSGGAGIGVHVSDPGGTNTTIDYRGWLATATNECFVIDAGAPDGGATPHVNFLGAHVGNCHPQNASQGAIENQNTAWIVSIASTAFFASNTYPTVYNVAGAAPVSIQAINTGPNFNVSGAWGGGYMLPSGVLTTVDPQSGTSSQKWDGSGNTNGYNVKITGNGATTPSKFMRVFNGRWELLSDNYSTSLISVDDSGNVLSGATMKTKAYAVVDLPTCDSTTQGQFAWVNDSSAVTAASYFQAVVAGGSINAPVFCDGTGWVYH